MDEDRLLLGGLIGLLGILTALLVLPYLQFLLGAILIAYILAPLQRRLAPHIGRSLAAASLVIVATVAIVLPFVVIVAIMAGEIPTLVEQVQAADLAVVEDPVADYTGYELDLEEQFADSAEAVGRTLLGGAFEALGTLVSVLVGLGLALFLLFFLVRDGHRLVGWISTVTPLADEVTSTLLERIDAITRAVLAGHVLVALIQGGIAGLGLAVTGVPNALFWTVVMMILALIPLIGTFAVWAPASAWLVSIGDVGFGIGLFLYGLIVVGISDEYLRPVIVDRYAAVNPGVIILGVIGGLSAYGVMGLFVGPIIIGILKEAIEVYHEHYG